MNPQTPDPTTPGVPSEEEMTAAKAVAMLREIHEEYKDDPSARGYISSRAAMAYVEAYEEMQTRLERLEGEKNTLREALSILQRNVILAIRRAWRGLRTQANPLTDLKAVVEALPPLETLTGMTPLCDRCDSACFKDCSKMCDIVLCEKCANIPPKLGASSSNPHD